jgi:hypothetical protein
MRRAGRAAVTSLAAAVALLGCAGGRTAPEQGAPAEIHDARSGLVVRVPDAWMVAPPGLIESIAGSDRDASGGRRLFVLVEPESIGSDQVRLLLAFAQPLPELTFENRDEFCRAVLAGFEPWPVKVAALPPFDVADHPVCPFRASASGPDSLPVQFWITHSDSELIVFQAPLYNDFSSVSGRRVVEGMRFAAPSSATPETDAAERISDSETGLSLDVPAGWWRMPNGIINTASAQLDDAQLARQRLIFAMGRIDEADEVIGFFVEPAGEAESNDTPEALCERLLALLQARHANAEQGPSRSIGGREFCAFRLSINGRPHRIYAAVNGDQVFRFQAQLAGTDAGAVEALLDAVRFE